MEIPNPPKLINIQDIIPDREIIKMENMEFAGIHYEAWNVSLPLFGDTIEKLLEHGFIVSMLEPYKVNVCRQLNPSPENLSENKEFWRSLTRILSQS